MRILFINRMLSMCRGGGETFDLEMGRTLASMGHEISYLSGLPLFSGAKLQFPDRRPETRYPLTGIDEPRTTNEEQRTSFHSIRTPYTGWFPWDRVRGGWRLRLFDFKCFEYCAARWCKKHEGEFDVIQVCELPFFVNHYKKMAGSIPVVIRLTAPNYDDPAGGLQQADAVIASGMSVQEIRKKDRPDCFDIPNCVDTTRFAPEGTRADLGFSKNNLVFLYVARFQAFKNHTLLIRAFSQLVKDVPAAKLVLVGSGPHEERVKLLVRELGLDESVRFLGEVDFAALPEVYRSADIGVISSDYESFCFAALEAMSTGLPIVTTDNGWVPVLMGDGEKEREKVEVLRFKGGWTGEGLGEGLKGEAGNLKVKEGGVVVSVGDDVAFSLGMLRLATSADLRADMGARNREYVLEHHQWGKSAEWLRTVYESVMNRAG